MELAAGIDDGGGRRMPDEALSIETILAEAVEIPDSAARSAFVERACGEDAPLRRTVEQLIANHFSAGRFLDTPLFWDGSDAQTGTEISLFNRPGPWSARTSCAK